MKLNIKTIILDEIEDLWSQVTGIGNINGQSVIK